MEFKSNFLAISILAAAVIIGGSVIWSANLKSGGSGLAQVAGSGSRGAAPNTNNTTPGIDDDVILGDLEAPVTLIEFGDYQCPFCFRLFKETEEKLREEFIKTGKLKMVYRDFPLDQIHPFARPAAEAAECARDEGQYWTYHDALFLKQRELATLDFTALAGELGMDAKKFGDCVSTRKYKDEVEKDYQDGIAAGVTGTPGNFIVAGDFVRVLPGALPYETFKAAIEEALQN